MHSLQQRARVGVLTPGPMPASANAHPGRHRDCSILGALPPTQETQSEFSAPASAWHSPGCWRDLGSQTADRRSLSSSVCPSLSLPPLSALVKSNGSMSLRNSLNRGYTQPGRWMSKGDNATCALTPGSVPMACTLVTCIHLLFSHSVRQAELLWEGRAV